MISSDQSGIIQILRILIEDILIITLCNCVYSIVETITIAETLMKYTYLLCIVTPLKTLYMSHWRIEGGQGGLAPPPLKLVKV